MNRRWPLTLLACLILGVIGCAHTTPRPELAKLDEAVATAAHHVPAAIHPDGPMAVALDSAPILPELTGPQPVDAYIHRALAENRTVRAAKFNVLALKHRIPQVTALEDPVVSNSIFPIPAVAPQYSLMGYMPYGGLLAQQFPWFGTLKLRGQVAEKDVEVALFELAAAQLDAVAAVKRAYFDLYFNQRAEALLVENRGLAVDFLNVARDRYKAATATQVDVLRAEVAVTDIDRELETTRQALATARAELARLLHVSPESDLRTLPEVPIAAAPAEVERLYQLAVASRPDLQGRLATIARDEKAVELARKRYYPNVTAGVIYQDMTERNAVVGQAAGGMPNVGLFVGFNLPVYRKKLAAGVSEAQARVAADAQLYEAERDQSNRDVKDLFTQAKVQQNIIGLLRRSNLPASKQVFEATVSDYKAANVDYLSLLAAWREVLQVQIQIAQVESELGKALALLERAVGVQLNEHPPAPAPAAMSVPTPPPPPATAPGPFRPTSPPADSAPAERDDRNPGMPARLGTAATMLTRPPATPALATDHYDPGG